MPLSEAEIAATAALQDADRAAEVAAEAIRNGGQAPASTPAPGVDTGASNALDAVFAEVSALSPTNDAPLGYENGGVVRVPEGAPKETPPPAAEPESPTSPEPATTSEPAPASPLLNELVEAAKATTPAPETPEDPYAKVQLRSDAAPRTKETFAELKRIAHERETAARKEADEAKTARQELEKQLTEAQTRLKEVESRQATPEIESELKELRAFRAQFDTENDPEFKTRFNSRIEQNYEAIYARLRANGLPAAEVEKLKSFDAAARDQAIDSFLDKLPPSDRRLIEAKLVDNTAVTDERQRALQEARKKADELLAERTQAPIRQQQERDAAIATELKPALEALDIFHVKKAPDGASPAEKQAVEEHNKYAQELQAHLSRAIVDDSPKTRAEAALALPLAYHLQRTLKATQERLQKAESELTEIKKAAATSRTARSTASPAAVAKPTVSVSTNPGDALDSLYAEISKTGR